MRTAARLRQRRYGPRRSTDRPLRQPASFIGQGYFIRGQLLAADTVQTELGVIRGNRVYQWPTGSAVDVLLRPDDIIYAPHSNLQAYRG